MNNDATRTTGIIIHKGRPADHETVLSVIPVRRGGRDLRASVLKMFFHHFQYIIFIAAGDHEQAGFLVGQHYMRPDNHKILFKKVLAGDDTYQTQ